MRPFILSLSILSIGALTLALPLHSAAAQGVTLQPVPGQKGGPSTQQIPGHNLDFPGYNLLEMKFPYQAPVEPEFRPVTFLKQDPPKLINERIERLIHGIYVDVPPEYDHYGYEIRRYMAAIGGQDVLNSSENIAAQLKNIKTAEIILKYWQEVTFKEISAIEAELEATNASSSTRSSFKYHSGVARAFFVEARGWMRNNRSLLKYLDKIGEKAYEFEAPIFTFKDHKQLRQYAAHYKAQQDSLEQIQGYTPFLKMVY